jgi:hypothetical protein
MQEEFQTTTQGRVPAEATLKFINRAEGKFDNIEKMGNELNTNFLLMKKDISTLCEKLEQHTVDQKVQFNDLTANQKEQFHELNTKIDGFINSADKRYAEKKIEHLLAKILWIVVALVITALGTAFFKLVLK